MKRFKLSLVAIALTAGIASAFAFNGKEMPKDDEPIYDWTKPGEAPFRGTLAQAQAHFGCQATVDLCASGVIAPGSPSGPSTAEIYQH